MLLDSDSLNPRRPELKKKKINENTNWANSRVKLHSQVHFESKRFWIPNGVSSKKLKFQKMFGLKRFWNQKILWQFVSTKKSVDNSAKVGSFDGTF